jgi:putative permease
MHLLKEWYQKYLTDPQAIILALLLVVGTAAIIIFGEILTPVLASLVIAYMLEGLVGFLQRNGFPRMLAVLTVFLSFVAFLVMVFFVLLPSLSIQVAEAVTELPAMIAKIQHQLMRLPERYPEIITQAQLLDVLKVFQTGLVKMGENLLSYSMASVRGLITFLVYLILMPLMVYFFLKDKEKILAWFSAYLPDNRHLSVQVWQEVDQQIGNYIRGKFWEILIIWSVSWVAFYFLKLKFAMLMGLLVGLSVIVPYIGVTVTTIPVALMGFYQWGPSQEVVYLMAAYGIIQLLDGNLLAPLLLSEVVNIHPVGIITAVLFFGGIWGFWGVFFAIPLATLVLAVLKAWPRKEKAEALEKKELKQPS